MKNSVEERVNELEKQLAELTAKVLKLTPVTKDWRQTVGTLRDDELAREADRRGAEWRRQASDTET